MLVGGSREGRKGEEGRGVVTGREWTIQLNHIHNNSSNWRLRTKGLHLSGSSLICLLMVCVCVCVLKCVWWVGVSVCVCALRIVLCTVCAFASMSICPCSGTPIQCDTKEREGLWAVNRGEHFSFTASSFVIPTKKGYFCSSRHACYTEPCCKRPASKERAEYWYLLALSLHSNTVRSLIEHGSSPLL